MSNLEFRYVCVYVYLPSYLFISNWNSWRFVTSRFDLLSGVGFIVFLWNNLSRYDESEKKMVRFSDDTVFPLRAYCALCGGFLHPTRMFAPFEGLVLRGGLFAQTLQINSHWRLPVYSVASVREKVVVFQSANVG